MALSRQSRIRPTVKPHHELLLSTPALTCDPRSSARQEIAQQARRRAGRAAVVSMHLSATLTKIVHHVILNRTHKDLGPRASR